MRLHTDASAVDTGRLVVFALDEAPPYYALSHCWGKKEPSAALLLDARVFYVSPDLAAGLQSLQHLVTKESAWENPLQQVWIDNICINQADVNECSAQLRMRGKIYSQSVRILVRLGSASGPNLDG